MSEIKITVHNPVTGRSENIPVLNTVTIKELLELGGALLELNASSMSLTKYGKTLNPERTLVDEGVVNGDLLALSSLLTNAATDQNNSAGAATSGGGLDFSNLLALVGASSSSVSNNSVSNNDVPLPFYHPGMTLSDAMESNSHPKTIVKLLQTHSHLFKEFNYHMPVLAKKIENKPYETAVDIWREDMVKNSLRSATAMSKKYHREKAYRQRLAANPNDKEAKEFFESKKRQHLVDQQYRQAMQIYPESMGRVLMLYIDAKINKNNVQAFVDSGAQTTIMSKTCAQRCGIFHLVDTRFSGFAVGVGTGRILGRIHIAQLQISSYHFPVTVTVMENATLPVAGNGGTLTGGNGSDIPSPKDMDFLLGLDMLKRFNCSIDLLEGKLRFRLGSSTLETSFLHEKDLDASKGGTKDIDFAKSNQELLEAQRNYEENSDNEDHGIVE